MPEQSENRAFRRPEIIRPPSEWNSYYLPVTSGCSNNTCTFCGYWGGSGLQMRDMAEVRQEIDALALYFKHGVHTPGLPNIIFALAREWDGKKIFLQDGDALIYPFARLVDVLRYLNEKLPALERVAAYATPQDILRRRVDELAHLRDLKLGMLYIGIESGDDTVLEAVKKGATHDGIVTAGRRVKESGILLSVTVILGLGGVDGSERHTSETARILTETDPDYAGALTLTLVPGTPLYQQAKKGTFHPITPFQSLEELRMLVEKSSFSNCFFSSMHASNYFSVRGTLPQDKKRMLGDLDAVLKRRDPALLRPEFMRGL